MTDTSLLVLLPFLAALAATVNARGAAAWGFAGTLAGVVLAARLALSVHADGPYAVAIGGWAAPLGISLRADGLAAVMIVMTALVGLGVCVQALSAWGLRPRDGEDAQRARMRMGFWPLWLCTLAALNGLYLSGDLFNLYVTFEILGLSAVGLTALAGTRRALRAAFDYLVAGLAGSLLLLLGVALAYAAAGQVSLEILPLLSGTATGRIAIALIIAGVALKAALFPLHFWMPPAHSSAAPAASAILSALVVKGALYLALRLLLEGGLGAEALRWGLAGLGAAGMLWGSFCALRADRLKLLVAYSTVAQIGLIMLAISAAGDPAQGAAWQAAALLMFSHALAKAAMFLAVGRIAEELGHDRISGLNRSDLRPGAAEFAFAIAAISLIGLPPTAGFVGKWVLIDGLIGQQAWPVVAMVLTGTVLSVAYLSRVVSRCLRGGPHVAPGARRPPWRAGDAAAIVLAFAALFMGLLSAAPLALLNGPLLS